MSCLPQTLSLGLFLALLAEGCNCSPGDGSTEPACPAAEACYGTDRGCAPFETGSTAGLTFRAEQGLVLAEPVSPATHVLWPSSAETSTILRVNTQTLVVEASFYTGPNHRPDHRDGCCGEPRGAAAPRDGESPSRTVVDEDGSAIVANRACNSFASITKIARDLDGCIDRNGDGRIETSTGWADTLNFDSHTEWQDECILWHTPVGGLDGTARSIVLEPTRILDGDIRHYGWVGVMHEMRFLQFDADTGELTGLEAETPGIQPYDAAIDREGWIWFVDPSTLVGRFSIASPGDSYQPMVVRAAELRRVIIDDRDVSWIASRSRILRWDEGTSGFVDSGVRSHRIDGFGGMVADGRGSLWIADLEGSVVRMSNVPPYANHAIALPGMSIWSIAADFDNHVWAFDESRGTTALVDIGTEDVEPALDDCQGPCVSYPYIRDDITGVQRRNVLYSSATWRQIIEGCPEGATNWGRLILTGSIPHGTDMLVEARTAPTRENLADAAVVSVPIGASEREEWTIHLDRGFRDAQVEPGHLLSVSVTLHTSAPGSGPVLRGVRVEYGPRNDDLDGGAP